MPKKEDSEDEAGSEEEEDERIAKLSTFLGDHTPEEAVTYLKNDLGGKDGLVSLHLVSGC